MSLDAAFLGTGKISTLRSIWGPSAGSIPANKNRDGGFRKVKVSLAAGKYHLAYRSGYYAVDPHAVATPAKDLASGLALAVPR